MKKTLFFYTFFFLLVSHLVPAQVPLGYYDGTSGLTGAALKTKLSEIISNGHIEKTYNNLYLGYPSTDTDHYFENDGSVLDMYSENPFAADPYNYQHGQKQCGNYSAEGDCYNREHIIPQSFFNSLGPMVSDIQFITPTDGKVNGMRSNNPFGVVSSPTFTSKNGSKLGPNTTAGFSGTVFEPIDAFKGDIARMIFYFVTRYESRLSDFSTGNMLGGSTFPGLQNWELQVLLSWSTNDPVDQREIDRNNAAYVYQGNRNPYIDNPQWITDVWGSGSSTADTEPPSQPSNLAVSGSSSNSVSLNWTASTDNVGVYVYEIYVNGVFATTSSTNSATVNGLAPSSTFSFYVIARDAAGNLSTPSTGVNGTTTAGGGGTPTSCGTEDFTNVPNQTSTTYQTNSWTTNGVTWTATDSRTDQKITTGNPAVMLRNGNLTSSTISGGISSLTITTQQIYTGSSGTFNLVINGDMKGSIPFSATANTVTIPNINVSGDVIISISDNSTSGNTKVSRVLFDNLSWTCYSAALSTNESVNSKPSLTVYPNPVKNNILHAVGNNLDKIKRVEIYSVNGLLVQVVDKPFAKGNSIQLKNINKGIYVLKADNMSQKFIVE